MTELMMFVQMVLRAGQQIEAGSEGDCYTVCVIEDGYRKSGWRFSDSGELMYVEHYDRDPVCAGLEDDPA